MQEQPEETTNEQSDPKPELEQSEQVTESQQPKPAPTQKPKSPKKRLIALILAIVLAVAVGAGATYLLMNNGPEDTEDSTIEVTQNSEESTPLDTSAQLEKFIQPQSGEVWLNEAVPVDKKGWLKNEVPNPNDEYQYALPVEYFKVGTHGDSEIFITVVNELGADVRFYEVDPNGAVSYIAYPAENYTSQELYLDNMSGVATVDYQTHYDSLNVPVDGLLLDSGYYVTGLEYFGVDQIYEPGEFTEVTEENSYYAGTVKRNTTTYEEPGLKKIWFNYELNFGYSINLKYEPIVLNGNDITWQRGDSSVSVVYSPIVRGCGIGNGVSQGFRFEDSDLVLAGTTSSGAEIYEVAELDYKLLTKVVEEYNDFYSYTEDFTPIDKQQMQDQHGLIFYKDSIGNWLVYTRDDRAPDGGCAKPVVYLYPEIETDVSVRVGADVKISDPLYGERGWQVTARPDGQLTVNGAQYGSLFWEGPGWGQYPGIVSGTIVKTSDAIPTIRKQLKQLSLNQNEIDDFVEYWADKMPNKPYTRLTWLTTDELDQLAPLFIHPKPDSVLRVFLDYSGLDKPYDIKPQTLQPTERNGFTVVEWGGLSPFKLY